PYCNGAIIIKLALCVLQFTIDHSAQSIAFILCFEASHKTKARIFLITPKNLLSLSFLVKSLSFPNLYKPLLLFTPNLSQMLLPFIFSFTIYSKLSLFEKTIS
ncbi:MAG: hypothetical protein ACK56F_06705, partial [bacterium]